MAAFDVSPWTNNGNTDWQEAFDVWSQNKNGQAPRGGGFGKVGAGGLAGDVNAFNADTGANAQFVGGPSGDRVDFGQGAKDVLTSGGDIWNSQGERNADGSYNQPNISLNPGSLGSWKPTGNTGFTGGIGGGAGSGSYFSASGVPGLGADQATSLYQTLINRANQGLSVDANDPTIKQQTNAFGAQQERQRRGYMNRLAEAGGANANLRGEQRMAMENAGNATGQFAAQAVGNEQAARRNEIAQSLQQAGGLLTEEQRMALQDTLSRMQLAQQESQFGRNLGLQAWDTQNKWDYANSPLNG